MIETWQFEILVKIIFLQEESESAYANGTCLGEIL